MEAHLYGVEAFEGYETSGSANPPSFVNNHAFQNRPSVHSTEGNFDMRNSEKAAGNNLSANNGRPRAFRLTQRDWRMLSSGAFREHVGDRSGAAKALADEVECSPKTAQSWLDGESTPAGILDLRAMATIPAYAALKREVAAMEMDMDPRIQAKLMELYQMTMRLAGE